MQTALGIHLRSDRILAVAAAPGSSAPDPATRCEFAAAVQWPAGAKPTLTAAPSPRHARVPGVFSGFVLRAGDPVPVVDDLDNVHTAERLIATLIELVIDECARRSGHRIGAVAVACPATYSDRQVQAVRAALAHAEVPGVRLIPETVAALRIAEATTDIASATHVLVADVGTESTTVCRAARADRGDFVIDVAERIDDLGTDVVDQALLGHILAQLPDACLSDLDVGALRQECSRVRSALTRRVADTVALGPGRGGFRLIRSDVEDLARAQATELVEVLRVCGARPTTGTGAFGGAGIHEFRPDHVMLVGSGADLPLVVEAVSSAIRVPVVTPGDRFLSALGALAAAGPVRSAARPPQSAPAAALAPAAAAPAASSPRPDVRTTWQKTPAAPNHAVFTPQASPGRRATDAAPRSARTAHASVSSAHPRAARSRPDGMRAALLCISALVVIGIAVVVGALVTGSSSHSGGPAQVTTVSHSVPLDSGGPGNGGGGHRW